MTLRQEQKDLLVGTLLGDGNLQSETKGRTWRYRALHKNEHREYLFHKYDVLKNLCNTEPHLSEVLDTRTNKVYKRWLFNTLVQDSLRYYGKMFYKYDPKTNRFIKDVPIPIEKILTPRAIAYWYMDDGSLKWLGNSNAMRICTESYNDHGVRRLKKALKTIYDIETQLTRKTNQGVLVGYRLAINERNSQPFRQLIEPYLIDCMRYKVSDGSQGHL